MRDIGTIRLKGARFFAYHGTTQEERNIGRSYTVDVEMGVYFAQAAREDNLDKTVDYESVYRIMADVMTSDRYHLIERLAYLIGNRILRDHADVKHVRVAVRKLDPPVGGVCGAAEAIYRATRQQNPQNASEA